MYNVAQRIKRAEAPGPAAQAADRSAVYLNDNRLSSVAQRGQVKAMAGGPIQRKPKKVGQPDQLRSNVENFSGHSAGDVKAHDHPAGQVIQMVGGEKISFDRTADISMWRGLAMLDSAINEMKSERNKKKIRAWEEVKGQPKDNISSFYSGKLEELKDEIQLIQTTRPFVKGTLKLNGTKIVYHHKSGDGLDRSAEIAEIKKGEKAFKRKNDQRQDTKRDLFSKGIDNTGDHVQDDRGTMTRRYAYVEKNYYQFMEFVHTNHMEGRYQKFIRAAGAGNGRPDVLNNDDPMVKQVQRIKGDQLTLEQLAFTHQYWGSGSQQRGLSLTSTAKPGVTIGNAGENFRTDGGFRIKIDLAKIPQGREGAILLNHYSHGGVKDVIKDKGGPVETNPLKKQSPYKYHSSVIKNRELYLEYLKPEWIVSVEYHPLASDQPGTRSSVLYDSSEHKNTKDFMGSLALMTGATQYGSGFESALSDEKKRPPTISGDFRKGLLSGQEYLKGYAEGNEEYLEAGTKRAFTGSGPNKKNTKKDWSESKKKKDQRNKDNEELTGMHIAKLTLEKIEHAEKTDIYRIGYIHGRMGKKKISKLAELV